MKRTNDVRNGPALTLFALVAFLAGLVAVASACRRESAPGARVELGGTVLEASLAPATPRVGENRLELVLHRIDPRSDDRDPTPGEVRALADARIEARVEMPAMGAMAAMGGPLAVTHDGEGAYHADFELAMPGTWRVTLVVHPADGPPRRVDGSLTVGTPGLTLAADAPPPRADRDAATRVSDDVPPQAPSAAEGPAEHPGEFVISTERLQRHGITTVVVERRALPSTIRAVGRVVFPESGLVDVALKVGGFASKVRADAVGVTVAKGDVLFELYSPELVSAQQEYVEALRSQARAHPTSAPDRADGLVDAARLRLRRWDVGQPELDRLSRTFEVAERLPIRAPISGQIVEKNLVEGSAFTAGERLYRIAPRTPVWLEASVHESDLERLAGVQRVRVRATHAKEGPLEARLLAILPAVDASTRTAIVRLVVESPFDPTTALRPNQSASVELEVAPADRLVVPESAVLQAGRRSFVFRVLGEGRIRPEPVVVGERIGEAVEIVSGVAEGDVVVRSGTFLVAAESRLRAALEQW